MTLPELIAALEAATEPSRELDREIVFLVEALPEDAFPMLGSSDAGAIGLGAYRSFPAAHYTSKIDEALRLVPEGFGVQFRSIPSQRAWASVDQEGVSPPHWGDWFSRGATPAIAICIAALKARGAPA